MPTILNEKTVFNDWFHVEEATVAGATGTYSRMRLNRPESAAVLIYNCDSGKVILTQQYRYAVSAKTSENLLEVAAGIVDAGERPEQAAIRECREETGYNVQPLNIKLVASCFMSPGYSAELLHHYYAEVSDRDKVNEAGGLKHEHEEIVIVEMGKEQFIEYVRTAKITDAKSLLLGYWYLNNKV